MRGVSRAAACTVHEEFNRSLKSLNQNNKHVCLYFLFIYIFIFCRGGWGGGELGGN